MLRDSQETSSTFSGTVISKIRSKKETKKTLLKSGDNFILVRIEKFLIFQNRRVLKIDPSFSLGNRGFTWLYLYSIQVDAVNTLSCCNIKRFVILIAPG